VKFKSSFTLLRKGCPVCLSVPSRGSPKGFVLSDEITISLAILRMAIRDWNNHQANRIELRAFFKSEWFKNICDGNGIDPETIRRRCKGYYAVQGTKKAATIEWALLNGVSLAMGISFPQYLILIMASGRSILNEKS
jgi:hypothetical protein